MKIVLLHYLNYLKIQVVLFNHQHYDILVIQHLYHYYNHNIQQMMKIIEQHILEKKSYQKCYHKILTSIIKHLILMKIGVLSSNMNKMKNMFQLDIVKYYQVLLTNHLERFSAIYISNIMHQLLQNRYLTYNKQHQNILLQEEYHYQ